jgi:hypothetical protein
MAMKAGVSAVSAFLVTTIALACILGSPASTMLVHDYDFEGPPHEHMMLFGYVYEADGVTPVLVGVVNITNKATGDWYLTSTDITYGYYMIDTGILGNHIIGGEVINITAMKGSLIGWTEAVAPQYAPYFQIDVTMSVPVASFMLKLVPGWNQICLPFINLDYTANTLGLGFCDVVAGYNESTGRFDKVFIVGVTPSKMDFAIKPSTGYEVFAVGPRNLTLYGALSSTESRSIVVPSNGGWVELGLASLTPRHASEIPAMYTGGTLMIISKWDPIRLMFQSYIPAIPFTDFIIYPGEGFWGYVSASGTFSYQP